MPAKEKEEEKPAAAINNNLMQCKQY